MNQYLTEEEKAILLALETNPHMPMTELAKKREITRITAKKRVDDLKAREIILNTIALYNQNALNLYRINVIAQVTSYDKMILLELACDEHPYTYYRSQAYGGKFLLYIQFNIPKNTLDNLKEFFNELHKNNIIEKYDIYQSTEIRLNCKPDLKRYNMKAADWNFSWKDWFSSLPENNNGELEKPEINNDYSTFNKSHFDILRLLTADGNLKQTDLIEKLGLSKTQAHREYNYVIENYISNFRLIYNMEIFDITETYLAIVQNVPKDIILKIYNGFKNNPPPFLLSIEFLKNDSLLIWCSQSTKQASDFAFSLWKLVKTTEIITLNTKVSTVYWFYTDNFDFEKKKWKTDRSYMVDEPIERLMKKTSKSKLIVS